MWTNDGGLEISPGEKHSSIRDEVQTYIIRKKMLKSQNIAQLMQFKTGVCMAFKARWVGEMCSCQVELCGEVCEHSCVCVFCRN